MAGATAVELLASMLQHPDGYAFFPQWSSVYVYILFNHRLYAPAPTNPSSEEEGINGVLGLVPHQLRGFLGQFKTMPLVGAAYDKCTGCSETVRSFPYFPFILIFWMIWPSFSYLILQVLKAYETQGFSMLLEAFNDTKYLEKLTGLDKLFDEGEAALESVDWDDEGEEAGDDFWSS